VPELDPQDEQSSQAEQTALRVLDLVRELTLELHPHKRRGLVVGLDDALDADLGFDSLGRVELLTRLERSFRLRLPEELLAQAATPRDLVAAVLEGGVAEPLSAAAELRPLGLGPVQSVPEMAATLTEMLDWHAETHAERTHIVLYGEGDREQEIRYGDLREASLRLAAGLRQRGLGPGESAAIMLPTSRAFFETFFGVLYAGGVPVPIYPPFRPAQLEDHLRRQATILSNAEARLLVAPPEAGSISGLLGSLVGTLRGVVRPDDLRGEPASDAPRAARRGATALLQYTSGSTGDPKGVVLSHGNLLANIRAMGSVMGVSSSDVFVSWLPLYHDMGLIGAWLGSLYHAVPVVILSPLRFLSRPESWLWAIHRHRATLSASPNFGYELCVRKVADTDIEGLDLSSWRIAVNGAEPVIPATLRRFGERFRSRGFRPEAMCPVYGLAESSVGLAFPPLGRGPRSDRVERLALTLRGGAVSASEEDPTALEFVACGSPLPGHEVRVVDASGRELSDREQGRLQFRGPSCTRGYFRNAAKTAALFDGDWLESGDLAYVVSGDVYITGRTKDVIIRAGRNVYPHELEEAVGDLPGVRKGCVAIFPSTDPRSHVERLIILAETRETDRAALDDLRARIEETAASLLETPPDDVVLAPPHTVLKTSSGKIRRAACREHYERGEIGARSGPVWWQIVRLEATALARRARGAGRRVHDGLYAARWWSAVVLCGAVAWVLVLLAPGRPLRWRIVRRAARLALWLSDTPLHVRGVENLPQGGAVLAVNHASYFDSLVLAAAVPGEPRFVAKRELAPQFVAGNLLRRLGALFVERFDLQAGVEDTRAVLGAAREGGLIVAFPEGTFGKPVDPRGADWSAAIHLRDRVRAEMVWMCGEPDLEEERIEP
jgi:1-acyl-sn-glycerol-3-phosphate acyltransferase